MPRERLVRIHASSGTGGKPTVVGYTAGDLDVWGEVMARSMAMAGVRPGMLVHNANGYGLFTGGLGFHHGAERLGATILPVSVGQTKRQVMLLCDLQAQVLCATPSYAVTIAEALEEEGIGPDELSLEVGLFGAEPWSEAMRAELERRLGLRARNCYGLSEIIGPGVAMECEEGAGSHLNEDHFLVEVLDPDSAEPVARGRAGRARDHDADQGGAAAAALPHGRHRRDRRDAVRVRAHARAHGPRPRPPRRHADPARRQRLPVGDRARPARGRGRRAALRADRRAAGRVGRGVASAARRSATASEDLRARVHEALRERTGIGIDVELVPAGSLPRSAGKAARVIDRRSG